MQLVLDTANIVVGKKNQSFLIKSEKGNRTISPAKLSSIAITANVLLEANAVKLAIKHEIPILFFGRTGKAQARLWSPYFASIATLRRKQLQFADMTEATAWMIDMFALKSEAQIKNLQSLIMRRPSYANLLEQTSRQIRIQQKSFQKHKDELIDECRNSLMGIEGSMARIYWQAIGTALPRPYSFSKRSRRPAEDIFNGAINYLYGMLYGMVEGAVFAAGLDPQAGFLHADQYNKPTLVFDLIEAFRPWADRILIEQCLNGKLKAEFFTKNQYGLFLNKNGKAFIIPLFNEFMRTEAQYLGRKSTIKNHIYFLAGKLAQRIRSV